MVSEKGIHYKKNKKDVVKFLAYEQMEGKVKVEKKENKWIVNDFLQFYKKDEGTIEYFKSVLECVMEIQKSRKAIVRIEHDDMCYQCNNLVVANTCYCPKCGYRVYKLMTE